MASEIVEFKPPPADLIRPVILCGGSGTRLWPSSRSSCPKQFIALFGGLSTFQQTLLRVADAGLFGRPVVVTNKDHRFLVADQLEALGIDADVLLEPQVRDSGPAALAGARYIADQDGETALVLALAADHMVRDAEGFRQACRQAVSVARAGYIVTFGVEPASPATCYGYVKPGRAITAGGRRVARFVEKPDAPAAERYVGEGFLWNSGNFLFQAGMLLSEYEAHEPQTAAAVGLAVAALQADLGFLRLDAAAFARAETRSIDYAVMERTARAAVVAAAFDWLDVGSWSAVRDLHAQDEAGNAAHGTAAFVDARANFVSSDGPLAAVVGLDDIAVITTPDAVLVARRDDAAGVQALVERLKTSHPALTREHRQSLRPWGSYRSLDLSERHKVKSITVKPGGRLSLQRHHHRSEHWIVVRGTALVTIGSEVRPVHENESVYIPIGAVHRMENPGKIDLEIIEVQTGGYLGEDDIIRLEDIYNREAS